MDLKELRTLVALSDLGSMTLAAKRLHLSPAAVHKQLKVLQAELGVQLYEHVGRGLVLTPIGQMLIPHLHSLLAQYDSVLSAVSEWKGVRRGLVRIGAGPTLSTYVLPVLMKRFRRAYPDVELLVETGNTPLLMGGLRQGSLDLALIVSADLQEGPDVRVETNWAFELVPVAHERQAQRRHCLADLARFPFILFQKGSRMEQPIDRYFAAHGFEPRIVMRFDNAEAIKAMIRAGLGISILPAWAVDGDIRQRHLHCIKLKEPSIVSRLALVSRKSPHVPSAVKAFIEASRDLEWTTPRLSYSIGAAGVPKSSPGRHRR